MSLSKEEVEKEINRRKNAEKELEKRVVKFLQECLLGGKPYCTKKEIEDDYKKAGFWIEGEGILSWEKWLDTFLFRKFSIETAYYKGEKYYKYRYKWLAKICSIFD